MISLKNYSFPIILLLSIFLGGLTGYWYPSCLFLLKPIGDIFLRLILTMIVPLLFFSVAAALTKVESISQLGRLFFHMAWVFLFMGTLVACYGILVIKLFPLTPTAVIDYSQNLVNQPSNISDQIKQIFTVSDFYQLLSHEHLMALIVFSLIAGIASVQSKQVAPLFSQFLQAGERVFMRVFTLIMYLAPLGFFAYFAHLTHELGPQFLQQYLQVSVLYYVSAVFYFFIALSLYAFWAQKSIGVKRFWQQIWLPASTAIATCSSAASLPANLLATKRMQIPALVYETAIPLGTMLHKEGSILGGVFKIAFLFSLFHWELSSLPVLVSVVAVSLLVGTVMGAIPSGGMLGELLILNLYGFPSSTLMLVAAISLLIDPIATLLNVCGNTASSLLIARFFNHKSPENNRFEKNKLQ